MTTKRYSVIRYTVIKNDSRGGLEQIVDTYRIMHIYFVVIRSINGVNLTKHGHISCNIKIKNTYVKLNLSAFYSRTKILFSSLLAC